MLLGAVTEGKTGRHSVTETHVAETETETHVADPVTDTCGRDRDRDTRAAEWC